MCIIESKRGVIGPMKVGLAEVLKWVKGIGLRCITKMGSSPK